MYITQLMIHVDIKVFCGIDLIFLGKPIKCMNAVSCRTLGFRDRPVSYI